MSSATTSPDDSGAVESGRRDRALLWGSIHGNICEVVERWRISNDRSARHVVWMTASKRGDMQKSESSELFGNVDCVSIQQETGAYRSSPTLPKPRSVGLR